MTPDVSASNFGITYYLSNFYDVLVEYQDGEYVGGLAEDWTISEMERSTHSIYGMM